MISCTEFIPLYSEFFKYLEQKGGHDAVMQFWYHISDYSIGDLSNPNSLAYKCEKLGGFGGGLAYWGHTLTEEACDLFKIIDEEKRFIFDHMRHCPSKGMLNELKHVEPYYDYCEHCNVIYQRVLDNYGMVYERDHSKIDNAECTSLLYEAGNRPDIDFKNLTEEKLEALRSEGAEIVDMKTEDNKYLHRDFHLLGDLALKYCGDTYGEECVTEFLTEYTKNYFSPQIDDIKKRGFTAIKEWLEDVYKREEASDVLSVEISQKEMKVSISQCPAVKYMHSLKQEPSEYYIEETRTLYKTIADACNITFKMEYYHPDGRTSFKFCNK